MKKQNIKGRKDRRKAKETQRQIEVKANKQRKRNKDQE